MDNLEYSIKDNFINVNLSGHVDSGNAPELEQDAGSIRRIGIRINDPGIAQNGNAAPDPERGIQRPLRQTLPFRHADLHDKSLRLRAVPLIADVGEDQTPESLFRQHGKRLPQVVMRQLAEGRVRHDALREIMEVPGEIAGQQ